MTLWKSDQCTNIDLLMFLKPLSNLFPSTRSCPWTKSFWSMTNSHDLIKEWWFESPALIPDLLDELPCLWSPLSQGWAPLSWNFKFVCYIFVCVLFNWSFRLFPTPYKRLLQTILAKQPFKSFFSQNITMVSLRVSENSYSQKQCSQHHSVSFLQIFTQGIWIGSSFCVICI